MGTTARTSIPVVIAAPVDAILETLSLSLLEESEETRLDSFRKLEDARRFAAGRILIRSIVTTLVDQETGGKPFGVDPNGRPYLSGAGSLDFNITHSGNWVAVGICFNSAIGVDIEGQQPLHIWHEIAKEFLTPYELIASEYMSKPDQFLKLWTAKEAVLKAKGTGLAMSPRKLSINQRSSFFDTIVDGQQFYGKWEPLSSGNLLAVASAVNLPQIWVAQDGEKILDARQSLIQFI